MAVLTAYTQEMCMKLTVYKERAATHGLRIIGRRMSVRPSVCHTRKSQPERFKISKYASHHKIERLLTNTEK